MQLTLPSILDGHRFRLEIALLFQAALAIFIFTVVVGILNGTDIVDFDQKTILTHVHTGTLGWLTLSVFASCLWLFGQGQPVSPLMEWAARLLSYAAVAAFLAYNYAFLTTYDTLRPTIGGFALAAITGFLVWVAVRSRQVELTTPHLGILAAVATSVVGGILGVLLGIELATGDDVLPDGGEDAHPATMVIGFLIPVGMALAEWAFSWPQPQRASRLGSAQMASPFAGGVLVAAGLLVDATPLIVLSLPFELAGVAIFARRMWPYFREVDWLKRSKDRLATVGAFSIAINIALFVYLVAANQGDVDKAPEHEILALDHVMFIGVMTNSILALLMAACSERLDVWPAADHLVFWGMNVGLAGFALGLFFDVTELKRMFTPIMGAALLLAVATFTVRLQARVPLAYEPAPGGQT